MRINRFIAQATGLSRRAADRLVEQGLILANNQPAGSGYLVTSSDTISYQGKDYTLEQVQAPDSKITLLFNKPAGYVVSRDGQGSQTIYDLLPPEYHHLKPIGRLDKYSSGLLLLSNDGDLAQQLTHPSHRKIKIYQVQLDKALQPLHRQMIQDHGINLEDGNSRFTVERIVDNDDTNWQVTMYQGRNRQIRRTFSALGYHVKNLHRSQFGNYSLGDLAPEKFKQV